MEPVSGKVEKDLAASHAERKSQHAGDHFLLTDERENREHDEFRYTDHVRAGDFCDEKFPLVCRIKI